MKRNLKTDKQQEMETKKVSSLVLSYSLTTLVALLFNAVYTLTDALFVSWGVGDDASGAVSVVMPFVLLQGGIAQALGGGAATIISISLGQGNRRRAGNIAFHAMISFYVTAVIVTAAGFVLMKPLLNSFGATEELYEYAKQYFIIILAGNVFSTGFSSLIRAEGKMVYSLLIWVIPTTVNIALDALFILALGWGIRGSAAATVICQFTSFSMMVLFFTRFTSLDFSDKTFRLKTVKNIVAMGIPTLIQTAGLSVMIAAANKAISVASGTLGVNTFAFVSRLISFAVVPFTALSQAAAPIVGFNFGAGRPKRIAQTVRFSLVVSFVYSAAAIAVSQAIPELLMRIFTQSSAVIALGAHSIRLLSAAIIFVPAPVIIASCVQAVGKKGLAALLNLLSIVLLIPLLFVIPGRLGLDGVWYSIIAACAASTLISLWIFADLHKRLR